MDRPSFWEKVSVRRSEGGLGRPPMWGMCIFMFFVLQGDEGRGRA